MADEASETLAGALRNWLGALGFILPLVGVEELVRHFVDTLHPTLPPWVSAALIVAGLLIYASPAGWKRLRGRQSMAIAVIVVSALGLMLGIYLLARPSPPLTEAATAQPATPEIPGIPATKAGVNAVLDEILPALTNLIDGDGIAARDSLRSVSGAAAALLVEEPSKGAAVSRL
jgi:hypothetical protein